MKVAPRCVCASCGRFSPECTYVQPHERQPYEWWCWNCIESPADRVNDLKRAIVRRTNRNVLSIV